ncbi:MAG: phosphatase PAP2 family protein [Alphaproteobacteria bacterium]|nr:phosphatase PAP2 family protein [Alphaproteobacteria bacterium]
MTDHTRAQVRALIREHVPLLVVAWGYVALGLILLPSADLLALAAGHQALNTIASLFLMLFFAGHALWMLPRVPEGQSAFAAIWQDLRTRFLTLRRIGGFVIVHLTIPAYSSVFGIFKLQIPSYKAFSWDTRFYELDRLLHLGHDPWRLLQPVLGHPPVTVFVNMVYNGWFIVLLSLIVWQSISARRLRRFKFFLVFLVVFAVMGTGMATAFSSAGPCFYGRVVPGPDPYAPLMAYLHEVRLTDFPGLTSAEPLWAIDTQETLWAAYNTGVIQTVSGISAMPSMHLAVSTMLVLVCWDSYRVLRVASILFAASILVGSVHLGWHYAADGYVSIALTVALWKAVGWVMRATGFEVVDEALPSAPPRV